MEGPEGGKRAVLEVCICLPPCVKVSCCCLCRSCVKHSSSLPPSLLPASHFLPPSIPRSSSPPLSLPPSLPPSLRTLEQLPAFFKGKGFEVVLFAPDKDNLVREGGREGEGGRELEPFCGDGGLRRVDGIILVLSLLTSSSLPPSLPPSLVRARPSWWAYGWGRG